MNSIIKIIGVFLIFMIAFMSGPVVMVILFAIGAILSGYDTDKV